MSFSASINRWSQKTQRNGDVVRRAVTLELFSSIIKDTPVDTGRLRSAWQCSIGNPDLSVPASTGKPMTKAEANAQLSLALNGVVKNVEQSRSDDTLVLTNNLPYVHRIEYDGWSHTKAPDGMVRRNVVRFKRLVSTYVQKLS